MSTDAQKLVDQFRELTEPGSTANTWNWAKRVTADLEPMGQSTIGSKTGNHVFAIQLFRCKDGSRFAYDLNGARQVWGMPDNREGERS
jgi:hypothetical protein